MTLQELSSKMTATLSQRFHHYDSPHLMLLSSILAPHMPLTDAIDFPDKLTDHSIGYLALLSESDWKSLTSEHTLCYNTISRYLQTPSIPFALLKTYLSEPPTASRFNRMVFSIYFLIHILKTPKIDHRDYLPLLPEITIPSLRSSTPICPDTIFPLYEIGRAYCHPSNPECLLCPLTCRVPTSDHYMPYNQEWSCHSL